MPRRNQLTPQAIETWRIIDAYQKEHGRPPGIREIMVARGIRSTNTVAQQLRNLILRGVLTNEPGKARTIRLLKPPPESLDQRAQKLQERGYLVYWYGNPAIPKYVGFVAFKHGERVIVEGA